MSPRPTLLLGLSRKMLFRRSNINVCRIYNEPRTAINLFRRENLIIHSFVFEFHGGICRDSVPVYIYASQTHSRQTLKTIPFCWLSIDVGSRWHFCQISHTTTSMIEFKSKKTREISLFLT